MKRLFLFIFIIFGCKAATWPASYTIDSEYKKEIQEHIVDLNMHYTYPILTSNSNKNSYNIKITTFGLSLPTLGMTYMNKSPCEIILSDRIFDDYKNVMKTVIWHEIGHCAGLEHVEDIFDIMHAKAKPFYFYTNDHINDFLNRIIKNVGWSK